MMHFVCTTESSTIYNILVGVASEIQSLALGSCLYIRCNTNANIVKCLWHEYIQTFVFFKNGKDFNDFS